MTAITPVTSPTTAPASGTSREDLSKAAKQFEAIFVRQMLSSARKANFGDSLFASQGLDTFRQMQDDRFADLASDTGAFGMAKMIEAHLAKMLPAGTPSAATTPATATTEVKNDGL